MPRPDGFFLFWAGQHKKIFRKTFTPPADAMAWMRRFRRRPRRLRHRPSRFSRRRTRRRRRQVRNRPELKAVTVVSGPGIVNTTPIVTHLNEIGQGLTAQDRIGRNVAFKYIHLRMQVDTSDVANYTIRILLVDFLHPSGAVFLPATYWEGLGGAALDISAALNLHTAPGIIRVLRDRTYTFSPAGRTNRYLKWVIPWRVRGLYNGSVGDETEVTKHSLFLVRVSDVASGGPSFQYLSRVRFTDA